MAIEPYSKSDLVMLAEPLAAKIKLYFASPKLTREEYQQLMIELLGRLENPVPYSPLHVRRQDIFYAMGVHTHTGDNFSKILGVGPLSSVAVSLITNQCVILGERFFKNAEYIFTEYMNIELNLARALKMLRHADQHELSSLRYSARGGEPRRLFTLDNELEAPILFVGRRDDREDYHVSPTKLHSSFEAAMEKLFDFFIDPNCQLRDRFDQTISVKNWHRFFPRSMLRVGVPRSQEDVVHPSEPYPGTN